MQTHKNLHKISNTQDEITFLRKMLIEAEMAQEDYNHAVRAGKSKVWRFFQQDAEALHL